MNTVVDVAMTEVTAILSVSVSNHQTTEVGVITYNVEFNRVRITIDKKTYRLPKPLRYKGVYNTKTHTFLFTPVCSIYARMDLSDQGLPEELINYLVNNMEDLVAQKIVL